MKQTYIRVKLAVVVGLIVLACGTGYRSGAFQRLPLLNVGAVDSAPADDPKTRLSAFTQATGESLDRNATVAVVCSTTLAVRDRFENINHDLAKYVAFRLSEHNVIVVPPDRVQAWTVENSWKSVEEIGAAFQTTYVVSIDLDEFSLYEEGNAALYRGRSKSRINVWKMNDDGTGRKIFTAEKDSTFPETFDVAVSEEKYTDFKGRYLSRLSSQIAGLLFQFE